MSPAILLSALYASLVLCALGLAWRASAWFRLRIGPDARDVAWWQRVAAAFRGAASALFGSRMPHLLAALLLDVLLLRRLFAREKLRWTGHLLVVVGFTLLLLMHALAPLVSAKLLPGYQATLDPYLFLRDLFGVMILAGVALLLSGRRAEFPPRRRLIDWAFVALLAAVVVTGFLFAGYKIASPRAFYRMTQQFTGSTDPVKLEPLRALWASEFGVAFGDLKRPIDPDLMERGRKMQRDACASCHSKPASAFVSYPVARALAPVERNLDAGRADLWLLTLHVFACLLGLASLPLTRFFHVVAAPASLLVAAAARDRAPSSAGRAAQRALALDACVHCGICDAHCSVAPVARHLNNAYLLPSHKLDATGALARGRLPRDESDPVAEGAFLCTDCGRCTSSCPVGLDLADLWQAGRGDLAAAGFPGPAQWVQARSALAWAESLEAGSAPHLPADADAAFAPLSAERGSFSRCVQCQTCTNVCPVVAHSIDAEHGVDLTPQKVMNLLRLGLRDLTLGSRMVWDCAGCYQCQENCPQGIRVADIMLELRALSVHRLGAVREHGRSS
ncbi:MAG TPA: 4Fe-4S dicluster domain-containing protein [Burkholderiales bacterium]|nr:4Fe-4S dicluster domain-containing protein [Burkholderiales bacterium]